MEVVEIRHEQPGDIEAIRRVNDLAFGRPDEGALVDRLRLAGDGFESLVAVVASAVVGHVLFTSAWIDAPDGRSVEGLGLAPLAVLPEDQGRRIGTELATAGLDLIRRTPCPFVIVLGHPDYYARFGFEPAAARGIRCKWDVPEGTFMLVALDEAAMSGVSGLARYRTEFDAVA
jgi:putative acetyltransferase